MENTQDFNSSNGDLVTYEEAEHGAQSTVHAFVRRGIQVIASLVQHEEGAFANVVITTPDGVSTLERFSGYDYRSIKDEASVYVEYALYPERDTRPRYGTPEWEREVEAEELAAAEAEFHGR